MSIVYQTSPTRSRLPHSVNAERHVFGVEQLQSSMGSWAGLVSKLVDVFVGCFKLELITQPLFRPRSSHVKL